MIRHLVAVAWATLLLHWEDRRRRVVLSAEDLRLIGIAADHLHGREEFGLAAGLRAITRRGGREIEHKAGPLEEIPPSVLARPKAKRPLPPILRKGWRR